MNKTLIYWSDNYIIDGSIIDKQHKKMISLINSLYQAFSEGKASEVTGPIIDELIDYSNFHFSTEEDFFHKVNYFDSEDHIAHHNDFIKKTMKFRQRFESKEEDLSFEIMNFMRDWLQNHILGSDKKYVPYL
jgi:hemerythrin-like metal-binding protein